MTAAALLLRPCRLLAPVHGVFGGTTSGDEPSIACPTGVVGVGLHGTVSRLDRIV